MGNFSELPNELLLFVAQSLSTQKDISSLSRTNWRLYHLLTRYLYEFNVQHHKASGLPWVIKLGTYTLTKIFLDAGANINQFGCTSTIVNPHDNPNPLVTAARLSPNLSILKLLLFETRPDQVYSQRQLNNLLRWAIQTQNQDIFDLIMLDELLLRRLGSEHYGKLLHFALRLGTQAMIECFLQKGASPATRRQSIMFDAAAKRNDNALQQLLRYDIRPHSTWTMEKLVNANNISTLQLVIDLGVEIPVYGHAALFRAIYRGHQDTVEFLIQNGANPHLSCTTYEHADRSTIWSAVGYKQLSILKFLLDHGVRPDRQDLELAIEKNFEEAVALLEKFSYEDLPPRMGLVQFTRQREAERLGDPGFYRLDWDHWRGGRPGPRLFARMSDH